ncbi:GreA/GreB family elongation factor [Streptomyces sp. NPDC059442]|uniref:GreA/GreB family elongation factor n=1 Tax=Streptomyces sp. NPDC059442 TaxID=3346830 RepID=UPI0036CCA6BA
MTDGPEPLSAVAREALERELTDLRGERATVAGTLEDEDYEGDRADQADELQRATELDRLDRRISEIQGRLSEGAAAGPPRTDVIAVGSTATVRFEDGTESTVRIGEVAEALDPTLVTADSPLGRALQGHRAGDTVAYRTPEGSGSVVVVSLGDASA